MQYFNEFDEFNKDDREIDNNHKSDSEDSEDEDDDVYIPKNSVNTKYGYYLYKVEDYNATYYKKYLKNKKNEYEFTHDVIYFDQNNNEVLFEYSYLNDNSEETYDIYLIKKDEDKFKLFKLENKLNFGCKPEYSEVKLALKSISIMVSNMYKHMDNMFVENDAFNNILITFNNIQYKEYEKDKLYMQRPIDYAKWNKKIQELIN